MLLFLKGAMVIDNEIHLGRYLRSIANALGQEMQQHSEQLGLTPAQGMFLHHLWYRQEKLGQITFARDLEAFFDVKHSTVSGILQRMEAAGFVTFEASEGDRRCKAIRLTQKAMDTHALTARHIQQTEAKLLEHMTPAEAAEFRRLLQIAAGNLGVCMKNPFHDHPKEESNPCSND